MYLNPYKTYYTSRRQQDILHRITAPIHTCVNVPLGTDNYAYLSYVVYFIQFLCHPQRKTVYPMTLMRTSLMTVHLLNQRLGLSYLYERIATVCSTTLVTMATAIRYRASLKCVHSDPTVTIFSVTHTMIVVRPRTALWSFLFSLFFYI